MRLYFFFKFLCIPKIHLTKNTFEYWLIKCIYSSQTIPIKFELF